MIINNSLINEKLLIVDVLIVVIITLPFIGSLGMITV